MAVGVPLLGWTYLSLSRRRAERSWRRVADALGLELHCGRHRRRLSGELGGVRVDAVWARWEGSYASVGADQAVTTLHSGLRLTARPLEGVVFDPCASGPALDLLRRRRRRARVAEAGVSWAPKPSRAASGRLLRKRLELLARAVREGAGAA